MYTGCRRQVARDVRHERQHTGNHGNLYREKIDLVSANNLAGDVNLSKMANSAGIEKAPMSASSSFPMEAINKPKTVAAINAAMIVKLSTTLEGRLDPLHMFSLPCRMRSLHIRITCHCYSELK